MISLNLQVGDIVNVYGRGEQYTTYIEWIEKNIESIHLRYMFDYGNPLDTSCNYEVIYIAKYDDSTNELLAYIQNFDDRRCYLIGVKGLQKVNK